MNPISFQKKSKQFIGNVIRQRGWMRANYCSLKEDRVCSEYARLLKYWVANAKNDHTMARIVVAHYEKLRYLLPGEGAATHDSLIAKLNGLRDEARVVLN